MVLIKLIYVFIILSNILFAQSASLNEVSTVSDAEVSIPLNVFDFPNIEAINFKIHFNPDAVEVINVTKNNMEICNSCYSLNYNIISDTLAVVMYNIGGSEVFLGDGHIISLNFLTISSPPDSSHLDFTQFIINENVDILENTQNGQINIREGSLGCINFSACNYDPEATIDDPDNPCLFSDCEGNCTCENEDGTGGEDCLMLDLCNVCNGNNEPCSGCLDEMACNYDPLATADDGSCEYADCNGVCAGSAQFDECGTCLEPHCVDEEDSGENCVPYNVENNPCNLNLCPTNSNWNDTCLDCYNVPNGSAYFDACDNCVAGTSENEDCIVIEMSDTLYNIAESTTDLPISLYAQNIPALESLDAEVIYNHNIININTVDIFNTPLSDSTVSYGVNSFVENIDEENSSLSLVIYSIGQNLFSSDILVPIFNILFNPMIESTMDTELNFVSLTINEVDYLDYFTNPILSFDILGCMDPSYCNFNPLATHDLEGDESLCSNGSYSCPEEFICPSGDDCIGCDCFGECESDLIEDDCQICGGSCFDGQGIDCNDVCCGGAVLDDCGFCDDNSSNDCVEDCHGVLGGLAYIDACGICVGGNTGEIDCIEIGFDFDFNNGDWDFSDDESIFASIYMKNLPPVEGMLLSLTINPVVFELNDWSIDPNDIELYSTYISVDEYVWFDECSDLACGECQPQCRDCNQCVTCGSCTNDYWKTKSSCEGNSGYCSDWILPETTNTITNESDCLNAGFYWQYSGYCFEFKECSNPNYDNQSDCEQAGHCSNGLSTDNGYTENECLSWSICVDPNTNLHISQYTNQNYCEEASICSNETYTNQSDCEDAEEVWINLNYQWTPVGQWYTYEWNNNYHFQSTCIEIGGGTWIEGNEWTSRDDINNQVECEEENEIWVINEYTTKNACESANQEWINLDLIADNQSHCSQEEGIWAHIFNDSGYEVTDSTECVLSNNVWDKACYYCEPDVDGVSESVYQTLCEVDYDQYCSWDENEGGCTNDSDIPVCAEDSWEDFESGTIIPACGQLFDHEGLLQTGYDVADTLDSNGKLIISSFANSDVLQEGEGNIIFLKLTGNNPPEGVLNIFNLDTLVINENTIDISHVNIDTIGALSHHIDLIPEKFYISQNYPNPFNPTTRIDYSIPIRTQVKITIYDIQGRLVKNIVDDFNDPGHFSIFWDGKNDLGNAVPSGLYLYSFNSPTHKEFKKLVLLK